MKKIFLLLSLSAGLTCLHSEGKEDQTLNPTHFLSGNISAGAQASAQQSENLLASLQNAFSTFSKSSRDLCNAVQQREQLLLGREEMSSSKLIEFNTKVKTFYSHYQKARENLEVVGKKLGLDLSFTQCHFIDSILGGMLHEISND